MNKTKTNRFAGLDLLAKRSKAKVDSAQLVEINLVCRASMLAFKAGCGTEQHWSSLAYCLNIAMVLAELGVIRQGLSAIEGGQNALEIVRRIGTWQLGSHVFAINCAVNIFKTQLENATNQQMKAAIAEVLKRNEQSRVVGLNNHCRA